MNLASKRICVTGGAGFLGSFLVETLRSRGCRQIFVPRRRDYDLTTADGIQRLFDDAFLSNDDLRHLGAGRGKRGEGGFQ